jgi:hypothetical protein
MKHIILFFFLSLVVSFFYFGCKQQVQVIRLNEGVSPIRLSTKYQNYINPEDLNLKVKSTYAFVSEDGKDYAVIVRNAYEFMNEVEKHFKVRANESTLPSYFTVKNPVKFEYVIEIYCVTDDSWPDAPPRIIIRTQ